VLYIVTYGVVDEDEEKDLEYERPVVYRKDAFWDSMLSDDTDCMDSDEDTTMLVDKGVGNIGGVVEDEDEDVEGDVGADGDGGEDHAGEGNGGKGVNVEGDDGEGGDESDGSVEKYDNDQL
jgi:hypothetical protein